MNLTWVDWGIVVLVFATMLSGIFISKRYMRSVADFLAANRTGGRYLLAVSSGVANLGAITVIAFFEQNYLAGFAMTWWSFSMGVVMLVITLSGWVNYRFRQSRALTMAQFFEMRYSRKFRVFAGSLAFIGGILNFGIFPAVGARFFMYFCGLPHRFTFLGADVSTFAVLMILLLTISLYFVFAGGQIAVIITDFIQGTFVNIMLVAIVIYFVFIFDYDTIYTALQTAPKDASMINPFETSAARDFNFWFFMISIFGNIYNRMSHQGEQAYNSSAKSAHEAKMAQALSNWREIPRNMFLLFIPICAYTVMHHVQFSEQAAGVQSALSGVDSTAIRSQLTVPLVLTQILPAGLIGGFAAAMLAAFISTHDTYLHSWGSIFIQDVVLPLRKKPLTPQQHIQFLRYSILGVAVFVFFFSLFFQQSQYILLFFAITGAIFFGGSGAVLIGGLYWKRGTTAAAYASLITGSVVATGGIIIHQLIPDFFINGQVFYFIAMVSACVVYIAVSLLGKRQVTDLDKLLHRGKYALEEEYKVVKPEPLKGLKWLGMGKEFTRGDRAIYIATYAWVFSWFAVFVIGVIYNLTHFISDATWMSFWYVFLAINVFAVIFVVIWFTVGGLRDLKFMMNKLKTIERDPTDDGSVSHAASK